MPLTTLKEHKNHFTTQNKFDEFADDFELVDSDEERPPVKKQGGKKHNRVSSRLIGLSDDKKNFISKAVGEYPREWVRKGFLKRRVKSAQKFVEKKKKEAYELRLSKKSITVTSTGQITPEEGKSNTETLLALPKAEQQRYLQKMNIGHNDVDPSLVIDKNLNVSLDDENFQKVFTAITAPMPNSMEARFGLLLRETTDVNEYFKTNEKTLENFNWLIRAQGAQKKLALACSTFNTMKEWGFSPDMFTYNAMITACAVCHDVESASNYLVEMRENNIEPTLHSYGALVLAYTRNKQIDDAFDLVEAMRRHGYKPDQVIYSTLIRGCVEVKDYDRAWQTFEHLPTYVQEFYDEVTYSLMIGVAGKEKKVEKALQLFEEMQVRNLVPTDITYNSLISSLANFSKPKNGVEYYDKMFEIFASMEANGYVPDVYTYTTVFHACANMGDIVKAREFIEKMRKQGVTPNTVTFNTLLDVYAHNQPKNYTRRMKNIEESLAIFNHMKKTEMPITIVTLTSLLAVYTKGHKISRAEKFFCEEFTKHGFMPNEVAFDHMIRMYCDCKRVEQAARLLEYLRSRPLQYNPNFREVIYPVSTAPKPKTGSQQNASKTQLDENQNKLVVKGPTNLQNLDNSARLKPVYSSFVTVALGFASACQYDKSAFYLQDLKNFGYVLSPSDLARYRKYIAGTKVKYHEMQRFNKMQEEVRQKIKSPETAGVTQVENIIMDIDRFMDEKNNKNDSYINMLREVPKTIGTKRFKEKTNPFLSNPNIKTVDDLVRHF